MLHINDALKYVLTLRQEVIFPLWPRKKIVYNYFIHQQKHSLSYYHNKCELSKWCIIFYDYNIAMPELYVHVRQSAYKCATRANPET